MSKFYIVSRNELAGTKGSDSGDFKQYTELGWELAIFRIYLNELIKDGTFDVEEDTVVTNDDRAFLYTKYCKNVVSFNEFMSMDVEDEKVYDITPLGLEREVLDKIFDIEMRLYNSSVHSNMLNSSFDLPNVDDVLRDENKFVCMIVRRRDWCAERSVDEQEIRSLIDYHREIGRSVYVMGKSCEDYDNGTDVFHVSFPEMAALINHKDCKLFISPVSGGGMIRFYTGNCKFVAVDPVGCAQDHVLFYGADVDMTGTLNDKNFRIVRNVLESKYV